MANIRPILVGAAIAALGLASANGISYAATGHALILGHKNYANRVTTIHRTNRGTALRLETHAGSAPLSVNRSVKVAHLNADLLDGKHASALQTRAIRYQMPKLTAGVSTVVVDLPNLPHGIYLASFNILNTVTTSGNTVLCEFLNDQSGEMLSYGAPSRFSDYSTTSASGVVDFQSGALQLLCHSQVSGYFNFYRVQSNQADVTLVRIDGLSVRSGVVVSATAQPRGSGGPEG